MPGRMETQKPGRLQIPTRDWNRFVRAFNASLVFDEADFEESISDDVRTVSLVRQPAPYVGPFSCEIHFDGSDDATLIKVRGGLFQYGTAPAAELDTGGSAYTENGIKFENVDLSSYTSDDIYVYLEMIDDGSSAMDYNLVTATALYTNIPTDNFVYRVLLGVATVDANSLITEWVQHWHGGDIFVPKYSGPFAGERKDDNEVYVAPGRIWAGTTRIDWSRTAVTISGASGWYYVYIEVQDGSPPTASIGFNSSLQTQTGSAIFMHIGRVYWDNSASEITDWEQYWYGDAYLWRDSTNSNVTLDIPA